MKLSVLSLILVWLAAAALAPAQAQITAPAPTTLKTAAGPAPSASHTQAALTLLDIAFDGGKSFDTLIEQTLENQLKPHPELRKVEPEMRAFFTKHMSWSGMRTDMAAIYTREFTEAELRETTRFYQTPTGRKMMSRMPQLMQAGMELGQRRVQDNLPELQRAIESKMKAQE